MATSVESQVLLAYNWLLNVLHHRWPRIYLHPAVILFVWQPLFSPITDACPFDGDPTLPSKKDPSWRTSWPRVVLAPATSGPNSQPYQGWYWLCYYNHEVPRLKLLPNRGPVAPRIGNEGVSFLAVSVLGRRLKLEPQDGVPAFLPHARPV
jgi:hypothetical protein